MGQADDRQKRPQTPRELAAASNDALRQAAVAIDPPPRGTLGIRELLAVLEQEVRRGFPENPAPPRQPDTPSKDGARRRG